MKKKTNKIIVGDLELDLDKFEVKSKRRSSRLNIKRIWSIKIFSKQPGQIVITREILLEKYGDMNIMEI